MKLHKLITGAISYPVDYNIFDNLAVIEDMGRQLVMFIADTYPKKDSVILICRGSSGAIIAGLVSSIIKNSGRSVMIYHIKKDGEDSHSYSSPCEQNYNSAVNVVIDDFIYTGCTIISILKQVRSVYNKKLDILCVTGFVNIKESFCKKFTHCITSI